MKFFFGLLISSAYGFSIFSKTTTTKTPLVPETFDQMIGGFGFAKDQGFASVLTQKNGAFSARWAREAELKHARICMLAAVGYPLQEVFHPLFGGNIDVPSLVSFQATPLQGFWPIVVAYIGAIEFSTSIPAYKDPEVQGWYMLKDDHKSGDYGFDPLEFGKKADLREQELTVGRVAMLGLAGMVAQELYTGHGLF
uniref:Uncharacterized protein n=1 Tax=Aureoumbra lagunensis TaxID=44058 RepID=A0A7S3NHW5_9STRA|mmetsp:Transcript_17947/g.23381  ORF Transcript_17947/g.23381 Transcript_17947/m.23381 type:complete len:196 (+) Transcript_17947:114-701(+)|eukprot:CAMPEP_0197297364 /NCGR_PEP_ID=MMETSP0890-20130614/40881_1 /TAXON_ID=44058 ORGANISM="Aureoumbra lagunensis, Strain CCMP1510" /NCGR_SAMPLE_ID=MMETSP0890 /ASSEMBLY_ACC=CAM_ASM_000533 /LENGTH=195 /DNA_ID=CAMNT_0042774473 /DNA_START=105 /DNA_END=692 /DNA_ORIENTATION=+